ncbi:MAG: CRISPR-associated protein Csx16 [Rhodocyclaceae bacterium]|nr:CRISPR-associated protein Csx16 [Rhodocyclaceae bacterium]
MTTYFVTRHPGALDWARAAQVAYDEHVAHLDPAILKAGDVVIGSLPVHLAAEVCARGARYFNLSLDLPASLRGRELDAETLARLDARLEEYRITKPKEAG